MGKFQLPQVGIIGMPLTAPAAGFLSMPIRSAAATPAPQASRSAQIEIDAGDGATVRLYDEAARSAIELVLSRLRGSR